MLADVALMLAGLGHVSLDTYFLDGTKIEANANKHTFTWRKSVEKSRERLRACIGGPMGETGGLSTTRGTGSSTACPIPARPPPTTSRRSRAG